MHEMKLVANSKKQVEETRNKEEVKDVIENADMLLTDDELDNVTGGYHTHSYEEGICEECSNPLENGICRNPDCILYGKNQPY